MPTPTTSRTPSPAPPAPIPLTPGPRASAFQSVFSNALSHTLRACSYANFASCFPTPAKHAPEVLKSVWLQITGRVGERARAEFEQVCEERDVVRGLNELERLVGEARVRRERGEGKEDEGGERVVPIPPHTLPPESLFLAHLAPHLQQTQKELDARLRDTQAQNEDLVAQILQQRRDIEGLVEGLEAVVRDLEGANGAMGGVLGDGEMRREVLDLEAELRGAGREAKL